MKYIYLSIIVVSCFWLSGCWDSKEIENLGIVFALAVDKSEDEELEEQLNWAEGDAPTRNFVTVTYQFVNQQASGMEGGGLTSGKPYVNFSVTGDSFHQITREVSIRRDRPVFSPHLKVIIVSAALLEEYEFGKMMDNYMRDDGVRPSCLVLISKGRASKALTLNDEGEIPAFRIVGITENQYRTTKILEPVTLIQLQSKIQSNSSFLMQNIISDEGEMKFEGAAVIDGKTNKLKGFLTEVEVQGIMWITGEGDGGLVKSYDPETNRVVVYDITSMQSKITPHVEGETISFDVAIESEGRLSENWTVTGNPFENEFFERVEKATKDRIEELANKTIKRLQEDFKVDVADFGEQLRIHEPKTWEKVKGEWDQIFSTVEVRFQVDVNVQLYGTTGGE